MNNKLKVHDLYKKLNQKIERQIISVQNFIEKQIPKKNLKQSLINEPKEKLFNIYKKYNRNIFKDNNPLILFQYFQNYIEKTISKKQEEVLLKQSSKWASSITWTLIAGTFFGIGWLSVAKTDEIVIARGKLEPMKKVIDVKIPIGGVVDQVEVKEGDKVTKGQIILRLDKESSENKVKTSKIKLDINKEILETLEDLVEFGAVAKLQYLEQKIRVATLENEYIQNTINMNYQEIKAPADGIVFELKPRGAGYVAQSSEPVLQIVPIDSLKAQIEIDSRTIGFVSVGKQADISIDSFPASDFGVIEGEVTRIGSDALPPNPSEGKGYRFPAEIKIKSQTLQLKNGKTLPLQVGMSLTANIKLRKVSYLQLLLGTFNQKAESLKSI